MASETKEGVIISIHASRVGGDAGKHSHSIGHTHISIHASRVGGDDVLELVFVLRDNINPRLPGGRRLRRSTPSASRAGFQSTPPGWEATGSTR